MTPCCDSCSDRTFGWQKFSALRYDPHKNFIVEKIIDTENPQFHYQTSSSSLETAQMKFQDPTGNQMIEMQKKALESLLYTSY